MQLDPYVKNSNERFLVLMTSYFGLEVAPTKDLRNQREPANHFWFL